MRDYSKQLEKRQKLNKVKANMQAAALIIFLFILIVVTGLQPTA